MNLGGNLDANLGGKTHNFVTLLLLYKCTGQAPAFFVIKKTNEINMYMYTKSVHFLDVTRYL